MAYTFFSNMYLRENNYLDYKMKNIKKKLSWKCERRLMVAMSILGEEISKSWQCTKNNQGKEYIN